MMAFRPGPKLKSHLSDMDSIVPHRRGVLLVEVRARHALAGDDAGQTFAFTALDGSRVPRPGGSDKTSDMPRRILIYDIVSAATGVAK